MKDTKNIKSIKQKKKKTGKPKPKNITVWPDRYAAPSSFSLFSLTSKKACHLNRYADLISLLGEQFTSSPPLFSNQPDDFTVFRLPN